MNLYYHFGRLLNIASSSKRRAIPYSKSTHPCHITLEKQGQPLSSELSDSKEHSVKSK